jgi:Cu(I)/Ag(I) efflux system membrane fusion protein/cobalt-zinc-cadmium efflux system membrane fusion protein
MHQPLFRRRLTWLALAAMGLGMSIFPSRLPAQAPAHDHGAAAPAPSSAAPLKTLYTCGMHPEIVEDEPGLCPKCEMKLVPMDSDRARMILEARGEIVPDSPAASGERKILYWRAPMDPTYIRDSPGKSPMGMDLVPVYEDQVAGGPSIRIDPVTEQNMGLRYGTVRLGPIERSIRTVGTVDYDENGLGMVTTKVAGWVEKLHVSQTGTQVHAGDPLFEFYSPDLYSAQEEYLQAARDTARGGETADLARRRLESGRDRLRLFDIAEPQIEALRADGKVTKTLTIATRQTGIVTEKMIVQGDYLQPGQPAYKIADLSNVWVIGRVFENDLPFIKLGQEVQMQLDYLPGRVYRGRVTYIYPYLKPGTREIPVRMEFHNPGYDLKPGMYATLTIRSRISDSAILAPVSAVIDTGRRQVAFVSREPGKFEARRVRVGVRTENDKLQILDGLAPGEKIVVSGQFLLDSESRLREATLKMLGMGMRDETDSMPSPADESTLPDAVETSLRFVCPMPAHAGVLYDRPGDCPLCGMKMVPTHPWQTEQPATAYWTCPMPEHAHVRLDAGGKCPECAMTLIPVSTEEAAVFEKAIQAPPPAARLYTCPMAGHADVVSDQPGRCPKCNMVLVPTSQVPHGPQSEKLWHEQHDHPGETHE